MTTGRINQVRTIGGARAPVGPRPPGCGPQHALARPPARPHAGPPRALSAGTRPQPGSGGFGRPGASPHASEERTSGRAGGRAAHAGWLPRALARQPLACAALSLGLVQAASDARARLPAPRRSVPQAGPGAELPMRGGPLARQPPACAVLAWPDGVPASFWFTRSERRRLHASSRGAPLGTVRLRTATRTKACDPSATASAPPPGRPPLRKDTSRLRGFHRSPHAPGPSRRDGAPAPGYGRPTAGRRPGLGSVGVRSWRPGRRQRPCHRALCVLTRRGCPILYVPAQCAPAKTEALLPSHFWEGRRDLLPSQKREGRSVGRAGRRAAPGVATGRGTLADGRGGGMHRNR